ncbi:ATP-binding protein [Streptomyces sp. DT203]|uniref:ATP-binding protein n=1 Tax=Streptomyces sp. DT203 TaxID=3393424 RepID=UPI003CF54032
MDGSVEHFGQLDFLNARENVILLGPVGTGNSHFTEGLAQAAIEIDLRVARFPWRPSALRSASPRSTGPPSAPSPGSAARTLSSSTTSACCPSARTPPKRSTASSTPPTNAAPSR